jgi:hypothetical protein
VRPVAPQRLEEVAVVGEHRIREQLGRAFVFDLGPVEAREEQLRLEGGGQLLQPLEKSASHRIGRVHREAQVRVGAGADDEAFEPLQLLHGLE